VKPLFADGADDRLKLMDKAAYLDVGVEVIKRCDDHKGFQVLPRRWGGERTFGWMTKMAAPGAGLREAHRRLARHDPRRHGPQSRPEKRPSVIFKTDSNSLEEREAI
jgi:hypothetical protein